jgi:hypothetical protein
VAASDHLERFDAGGNGRWHLLSLPARGGKGPRRVELDTDDLPFQIPGPWRDRDRVAADGELARVLDARAVCVPEIVQSRDQVLLGDRLAAAQLYRPCIDPRQRPLALAMQARVDHP